MVVIQNREAAVEEIVVSPTKLEVDAKEQVNGDKDEFVEARCEKASDWPLLRGVYGREMRENYPFPLKYFRGYSLARAESRLERPGLVGSRRR